jgi:hypothetical protein
MARVDLEDTWTTAGDAPAVKAALRGFFRRRKMQPVEEIGDELRIRQGSQLLTRLLGGWFVPATWLPKRAAVLVRQTADGVRIRATIEEAMGLGVMDPLLKRKYQGFFETWMDDLRKAVR